MRSFNIWGDSSQRRSVQRPAKSLATASTTRECSRRSLTSLKRARPNRLSCPGVEPRGAEPARELLSTWSLVMRMSSSGKHLGSRFHCGKRQRLYTLDQTGLGGVGRSPPIKGSQNKAGLSEPGPLFLAHLPRFAPEPSLLSRTTHLNQPPHSPRPSSQIVSGPGATSIFELMPGVGPGSLPLGWTRIFSVTQNPCWDLV